MGERCKSLRLGWGWGWGLTVQENAASSLGDSKVELLV